MPIKSFQSDNADAAFPNVAVAGRHHQADAGKVRWWRASSAPAAATARAAFQRVSSAAGTSRPIATSISSATKRASRPWSRRSNTIRTAARASLCCIMSMARSATSWRRSGLEVGRKVTSGPEADILVGNALPLKNIPAGTVVHNIELRPGKGGQMARSAGAQAQLVSKEGDYALLKLPSGEIRSVLVDCMATDRPGGQRRARKRVARQSRAASAGWARRRTTAASR